MAHRWYLTPALTSLISFLCLVHSVLPFSSIAVRDSPLYISPLTPLHPQVSPPPPLLSSLLSARPCPWQLNGWKAEGTGEPWEPLYCYPLPQPHLLAPELLRCDKAHVNAYLVPSTS